MLLLPICCLLGVLTVSPEAVAFLGERAEPEIRTGCVVYGGEYLKPPYTVKRMGNEVLVNEKHICWFVPWPVPKAFEVIAKPSSVELSSDFVA